MSEPMFSIEIDPDNGTRIIVVPPDGAKVIITGGQSPSTRSETSLKLAGFLERNPPQAH